MLFARGKGGLPITTFEAMVGILARIDITKTVSLTAAFALIIKLGVFAPCMGDCETRSDVEDMFFEVASASPREELRLHAKSVCFTCYELQQQATVIMSQSLCLPTGIYFGEVAKVPGQPAWQRVPGLSEKCQVFCTRQLHLIEHG